MKLREHGEHPFKYWVFEDPIHPRTAQEIYSELGHFKTFQGFYKYDNAFEKKYATDKWELFPPITKAWLSWTLTGDFVKWAEEVTGLKGLIPDPHLRGGGIHAHKEGGILKPHLDTTQHPDLKLIRRLNYIIYFNRNYEKSWGGGLELWSRRMNGELAEAAVTIEPGYNVGVLFETPNSPHGFSTPWAAPDGITRKSLAVYLYTSPTQAELSENHLSTQFLKTPGEKVDEQLEDLRRQRNMARLSSNV